MITDLSGQIETIEKLMKLMEKYDIDEVSIDYLNLKKSKHQLKERVPTDKEILDKHTLANAKAVALDRVNEIEAFLNAEQK